MPDAVIDPILQRLGVAADAALEHVSAAEEGIALLAVLAERLGLRVTVKPKLDPLRIMLDVSSRPGRPEERWGRRAPLRLMAEAPSARWLMIVGTQREAHDVRRRLDALPVRFDVDVVNAQNSALDTITGRYHGAFLLAPISRDRRVELDARCGVVYDDTRSTFDVDSPERGLVVARILAGVDP